MTKEVTMPENFCANGTPDLFPERCVNECPKDRLNNCKKIWEQYLANMRELATRKERYGRKMVRRCLIQYWKEEGYYALQEGDQIQAGDAWFKLDLPEGPWVEIKEGSPEVGMLYDTETMDLIRREIRADGLKQKKGKPRKKSSNGPQ